MKVINNTIMKNKCDVLVIGSGVAGLFTALNIDPSYTVHVITKNQLSKSNSTLAQGGIVSCVDSKIHYEDTMKAGCYYNNKEAVNLLGRKGYQMIQQLIEYGVMFDRNNSGGLKMTREGGHTQFQVAHCKDETGKEIMRALSDTVSKKNNIKVREKVFALDTIVKDGIVHGVDVLVSGKREVYESKITVLATGGIGDLYESTTNERASTGDGIAIAYRAGANIKDMEFIQFHPTALYHQSKGKKLLISEAVRGEGGVLKNKYGEAFMGKYHKMKDLAPRDIVARSIFYEMQRTKTSFVYLDITHLSKEFIQNRFPMIYRMCLSEQIDITKNWISVAPAAHYIMGGIETDSQGRTTVKNLYACGECARTGAHGANRLASNSLLEGVVFGKQVADDINQALKQLIFNEELVDNEWPLIKKHTNLSDDHKQHLELGALTRIEGRLKQTMNQYVSISRDGKGLIKARYVIDKLKEKLQQESNNNIKYYELINQLTVSELIIESAFRRKKSLGAHYRLDNEINNQS
ncbi:L-aspartate oxidase [Alkaliphilus metalliredigens QYMF]|uniref:L-aspartate oxidase n=1 Tax=Alkaliphilus metalliredigens (strain QYMF) TaxID=293826 RepID=A6TJ93_ALKMQ|nr:L-aspartate oxidase [Alkaliphilus metalliredigens]ABR46261.1 L-aspartate oxidase [Alkaliphilus metalliredigens QYMF]